MKPWIVWAENGRFPVSSRYSTAPSEYRSARASTPSAADLLGRHVGDGADELADPGELGAEVSLTTPKSISFTGPSGRDHHVAGVMSRCTRPRSWM